MSDYEYITASQIEKRKYWIDEIAKLSGNFVNDFEELEKELIKEISAEGLECLLSHIRLSGAIPEKYSHDSSEEKLYSKYTDALLAESFRFIGLKSLVITGRADVADVECVSKDYDFVADAKAFRLSRTAKNQKDFKVQAMDGWKHGKRYAIVVCPSYQLPSRNSQIYQQAAARDVCILTYSHLAVLTRFAKEKSKAKAKKSLLEILKSVGTLTPSKASEDYWRSINGALLDCDKDMHLLWKEEKIATVEAIQVAKIEALSVLAEERRRIMMLSKTEAVKELVRKSNICNKQKVINKVSDTAGILDMHG